MFFSYTNGVFCRILLFWFCGNNVFISIILKVNNNIKSERTDTPEERTIERMLLLIVFVQMPSTKKANRQAGMHIAKFFIKTFKDTLVKSFLIASKFKNMPFVNGEDVLTGIINKQVGKAIVKECQGLTYDEKGAKKLASLIKDFRLEVKGTLGFDYAQVTKGGIPFNQVSPRDMQSVKVKDLYIVGEMLDVDGDCGGYNLQWAYSSAMTAADGVINDYENR